MSNSKYLNTNTDYIPKRLTEHCKPTRQTLLRPTSFEPEITNFEPDTSFLEEYERIEKELYNNKTAKETSFEFCSIYDDLIRFTNYNLYAQLKEIFKKEFPEEKFENEICKMFEEVMPIISCSLDFLEQEIEKILTFKNVNPLLIALILNKESCDTGLESEGTKDENTKKRVFREMNELFDINNNIKNKEYHSKKTNIPIHLLERNQYQDNLINFLHSTDLGLQKLDKELREHDHLTQELDNLEFELQMKKNYRIAAEKKFNEMEFSKEKLTTIKDYKETNFNNLKSKLNNIKF